MKKILGIMSLTILIFLLAFGLKDASGLAASNSNSSSNLSNTVTIASGSDLINAIINAEADYETETIIEITSDVEVSNVVESENIDIVIKPGQNITIKSQEASFAIGSHDLGYTITFNSNIKLNKQSTLTFDTNVILDGSSISANVESSETNDFYAKLYVNDSLTLDNGATIDSRYYNTFVVNGSLNVTDAANKIISNSSTDTKLSSPITLGSKAAIVLLKGSSTFEGTIEGTTENVVDGSTTQGVYKSTLVTDYNDDDSKLVTEDDDSKLVTKDDDRIIIIAVNNVEVLTGYTLITSTSDSATFDKTSGNYILSSYGTNYGFSVSEVEVSGSLNVFTFNDVQLNFTSGYFYVTSGSLSIGGTVSNNNVLSNGSNQIILDGGANWEENKTNGNYYFVTGSDYGTDYENGARARYNGTSYNSKPLIDADGSNVYVNLFASAVLQNKINVQTGTLNDSSNTSYSGGAVALNSSTLNLYGATIQFNALPNIDNNGGGAAIGARRATINMYDGKTIYNTVWSRNNYSFTNSDFNSADGAGISLNNTSTLNMYSGIVGYNHGDSSYQADGGGIMARINSTINMQGGVVAYNFTYGAGGGICVWESDVTISKGQVIGNRAIMGGGIATTSNNEMYVMLGAKKDEAGTITETVNNNELIIKDNVAYYKRNSSSITTGYGGGCVLGNSQYNHDQTLEVYACTITNNYATYGGGIANYSSCSSDGNKLYLYGGYISENKAYINNYGNGIFCDNSGTGNNPMLYLKDSVQVDTSNNIIMSRIRSSQIPIVVEDDLDAKGIVGLIGVVDGSGTYYYELNKTLIEYRNDNSGNAQKDKFLLDTSEYQLTIPDNNSMVLQITSVGATEQFVSLSYTNDRNDTYYFSLSAALNSSEFTTEKNNGVKDFTIIVYKNKTLTDNDVITIPGGINLTIKSENSTNPYTLSLGTSFSFGQTLFTVENGASLTLQDIIIDGNKEREINGDKDTGNLIVENNGTFTLGANAIIQNNRGTADYASVIEIGRGDTTTNIYGTIQNNEGYYGAIYSVYSRTVINISDSAKIVNTLYLGDDYPDYEGTTKYLEYLDIILEGGNINISNLKTDGEIGIIAKVGSGKINATNLNNTNEIGVFVGEQQYYRNNTIVNSNEDYSSRFTLEYGKAEYDKLMKSGSSNNTVLSMVLAIEISISDIWELNQDGKYYKIDSSSISVSDENFDTLDELRDYASNLGLSDYEPSYRAATKTIIFYIDTNKGLSLESLSDLAVWDGRSMYGFVLHTKDASTVEKSDFYGMTGRIATQDFSDNENHIYLGVVYQTNSYTINFNNGGLLTATQNMDNQVILYTDFETGEPEINPLKYYATGFVFTGWKVQVSSTEYVQVGGNDLVLENKAKLKEYISVISKAVGSNTFVLEAQWASIFTGETYTKGSNSGIGTSSSNAFAIKDKAGLNVLADTVNSIQNTYTVNINGNSYNYYNGVDEDNNLTFTKTSYLGYYFEFTNNIGSESDPVTTIIGRLDYQGDNFFTTGNPNNKPIQGPEILDDVTVFSGTLNGNNYTVYLGIDPTNDDSDSRNYDFVGLFGYAKDATISNIVIDGSVKGRISVGGLVGLAYGGNYSNIRNKANIFFNGINAGGIFGTYYLQSTTYRNGSITNVVNEGDVTYGPSSSDPSLTDIEVNEGWTENSLLVAYQGTRAGGIIGQGWHITLLEAYNSGDVTARFGAGGLVGTMISEDDNTKNDNTITTGFNSGNVTAKSGLATNYQYNSDVTIIEINAYVGGIVGRLVGASTVSNAMNTGNVQALWQGTTTKNVIDSSTNSTNFTYNADLSAATIGARGAGGIIGETSIELESLKGGNKDIRNVINAGSVTAWSHVGGIAGIFAYSDLSYALNIGSINAKGKMTYSGNSYAFNGALVGLGIAANLLSTAVFSYDISYSGYNDLTIQAIGNENGSYSLYGIDNVNSSKKLASAHLICQPGDNKPIGLDSTFFSSGWDWKSYDIIASSSDTGSSSDTEKESQYYYFPQLVSFVNNTTTLGSTTVGVLSKQAVTLKDSSDNGSEDEITDTTNINITLDVQGGSISSETEIKIDNITFTLINGKLVATINYNSYIDKQIDLSNLAQYITKESYYLDSWCIDSTLSEEFTGVVLNHDFTIYAKWEPTEYNIVLTGLQQYSNGNVELDGESLYTYTIEDFTTGRTLDLPTIKSNKAYNFEYWIFNYSGKTYFVTQLYFHLNAAVNTIRLTLEDGSYDYISLSSLAHLDFTLYCSPIDYTISYSYKTDQDSDLVNSPTNGGNLKYNINSTFDIAIPSSNGYTFDHWEFNGVTITSIQDVIRMLGVEGLTDVSLVGIFRINTYYLNINLNGGSLTNNFTYGDYTFTLNSQGLYQTEVAYNASIDWLWVKDNFINNISSPAGKTFIGLTFGADGSVNQLTNMPYYDLIVYAKYITTTYEILLDAGTASSKISFPEAYANFDTRLEYKDSNLYINASYGDNLEDILMKLKVQLIADLQSLSTYRFSSFTATYTGNDGTVTGNDGTVKFSYYNVQNLGKDPVITFNWSTNDYSITVFDSLGNYVIDYYTGNTLDWVVNKEINISKLKEVINTLNFTIPNGYTFNNKNFTITINNVEVYNSKTSTDSPITIDGYTIIRLQLEEKSYSIEYNYAGGTSSSTPTNDSILYNQVINLSDFDKPTRNGYNFVGWYYNGNLLVEGSNFIPSKDDISGNSITLVAHWEAAKYTIIFEFSSDHYWQGSIPNQTIVVLYGNNDSITLNTAYFNKEGYEVVSAEYDTIITKIDDTFLANLRSLRSIEIQVTLSIQKFDVTFDAGDGTFANGQNTITEKVNYYDTAYNNLPDVNPTKAGSEFNGYVSNVSEVYLQTPITKTGISFTAQYVANLYTITLITDETTETISNQTYGTSFDLKSYTPSKVGYEFKGWDDLGTTNIVENYKDSIVISKNYVLKAVFEISKYNLTFNVSDTNVQNVILNKLKTLKLVEENATWPTNGTFAEITYNTDLSSLNTLSYNNIIFKSNGANFFFSQMPNSDLEVTVELTESSANYQTVTGTIKYNDDSIYQTVTFIAIKQSNGNYRIINDVKYNFEGHNFANEWTYYDVDKKYSNLTEIEFDTTHGFNISATIYKKTFTITIIKYDNQTLNLQVEYGTEISNLANLSDISTISRPGYTFTDTFLYNGQNANNIKVTQDMTISMDWTPVSYQIIFEYTNTENNTEQKIKTYNYGAVITLPKIEEFTNLANKEYYTPSYMTKTKPNSDQQQKDFNTIFVDGKMVDLSATGEAWSGYVEFKDDTYSITFVLTPEPKQYTIYFVGNNIDNVINVDPLVFDIEDTISFTAPQIAHYNYIGISKVRDGEVVSSLSFDYLISLFDSNDLRTQSINAYLKYETIPYTANFVVIENEQKNTVSSIGFNIKTENGYINTPTNVPTKIGHTFVGWELNGVVYTNNIPVDKLLEALVETNVEIVAKFTPNKYIVSFYDIKTNTYISDLFAYGTTYSELYAKLEELGIATLSSPGYDFDGWEDMNDNSLDTTNTTNTITDSMVFTAKWTPYNYEVV